jgi:hypothetical protein
VQSFTQTGIGSHAAMLETIEELPGATNLRSILGM